MPTRREHLIAELTARLGRVCRHMPPDQFAELVETIAEKTLRYEQRAAEWGREPGQDPDPTE